MGKYKISIRFDTKFLNSLVHTEKSRVEIQRRKHHLALHPIHFNNLNESIKELLNEGVAKYSNDLNGILLGYQNIKLLGGGGMFHDDTCYTHCDVEADFFVFKPEIDEEMKGVVIRKSKDHVGLLVYNTFNVSIPAPRDQDDWLGKSVQIGYEVLFKIVHFSFTSYLPYLKGELISILTEVDSFISNETTTNSKQKKTKNKKIDFSGDSFSEELSIRESESHEVSPKKKKSKKDKSFESDIEVSLIESELKSIDGVSLSSSKKKEKRTKKVNLEASEFVSDSENFLEVSPKKKKSKKNKSFESEMEVSVIESELKDIEGVSSSPSKKKEKRTKKVKLEPSELVSDSENIFEVSENKNSKKRKDSVRENLELVGDLENSLDVSESIKTKKRKLSIGDTEETPKRKKKKHSL